MTMFADVTIGWNGKDYTIPAGQMMRAIAIIESVVTADELHRMRQERAFARERIARAFAAVLRFAGAEVKPAPLIGPDPFTEEVYAAMYNAETSLTVITSINALISLMIPQIAIDQMAKDKDGDDGSAPKGNPPGQA